MQNSVAQARESGLGVDSGEKHVKRLVSTPFRLGGEAKSVGSATQLFFPFSDSLTTTSSRIKSSGLPG
jgi:hypothetical protein